MGSRTTPLRAEEFEDADLKFFGQPQKRNRLYQLNDNCFTTFIWTFSKDKGVD